MVRSSIAIQRREDEAEVEDRDLEPEASKARLFWRALVSRDGHACPSAIFSSLEQDVGGSAINSSIEEQHVVTQDLS